MYLCMGKWKYVFMLTTTRIERHHTKTFLQERPLHSHTDTVIQTKDRESRVRRVVEVCKDILYERVAVGGQHNLPSQLIYRLSCQVLIVIVRQYLHTSMCYCCQLLAIPRQPPPPTNTGQASQPSEAIKLALQSLSIKVSRFASF